MKTLERLVLSHLCPVVRSAKDPLQFAYQPCVCVDDAVIYLQVRALSNLQKAGSTMRIIFYEFSSAFNTIQPALLKGKEHAGVGLHLTAWIVDYLTNQPRYISTWVCVSDMTVCSTAALEGIVLVLFLFTPYTADFTYCSPSCHLQKFSEDSAIVGLITEDDDGVYSGLIEDFVDWCPRNRLHINAWKTKEWWWISAGDNTPLFVML